MNAEILIQQSLEDGSKKLFVSFFLEEINSGEQFLFVTKEY
jgi:hypothetical protein